MVISVSGQKHCVERGTLVDNNSVSYLDLDGSYRRVYKKNVKTKSSKQQEYKHPDRMHIKSRESTMLSTKRFKTTSLKYINIFSCLHIYIFLLPSLQPLKS